MTGSDDGPDARLCRRFTRRSLLLIGAHVGATVALGLRFKSLQVDEAAQWAERAAGQLRTTHLVAAPRGRILDRDGRLLAVDETRHAVTILPYLAGDVEHVLARLGPLVALTPEHEERILRLAARQSPRLPIRVASGLAWEQIARINLMAPELPGIEIEEITARRYSHAAEMASLVGFVGRAPRPDRLPAAARPPDLAVGQSGVELGQEAVLAGAPGSVTLEVEPRSRAIRRVAGRAGLPGRDVQLTVETGLQQRIAGLLQREQRAALVLLDASRGEVLAMVSRPGPEDLATKVGRPPDRVRGEAGALLNRAIQGLYPPGSTIKMATALAGLESDKITPSERIVCTGSIDYHGHTFGCWRASGHGSVTLHRALRESCDCYFYEVARRVGIERLARAMRKLGLGERHEVGLGLVRPGVVADPDWKAATLGRRWLAGETLLAAIGQGAMLATPLDLAVMTARIATGRRVVPTVLLAADRGSHAEIEPIESAPGDLEALRRGMWAAVNEGGGTAHSAASGLDRWEIAGKTGTAQVARASRRRSSEELPWHLRDHALFVGYAPAHDPRFVAAAIVEHGGAGSKAAAPLVREALLAARDWAAGRAPTMWGAGTPGRERQG